MTDEIPEEGVALPVLWIGLDDLPVLMANQFVGQVLQDEIILSFGSMVPPPVIGATVEERRDQIERLTHVQVRPMIRISVTRRRLEELQALLRDTLTNYDNRYGQQGGA